MIITLIINKMASINFVSLVPYVRVCSVLISALIKQLNGP